MGGLHSHLALLLAALVGWGIAGALVQGKACAAELPLSLARQVLFDEPYHMLEELGKASDDGGALTRTFLSPAHTQAAGLLQAWMRQAGMRTWVDGVANVHGRADGAADNVTETLVGSHYDTVVDGGKYDGALGIIAGIAAVKARVLEAALCKGVVTPAQAEALQPGPGGLLDLAQLLGGSAPAQLPEPVHVIGFSDEEGVRFQSTFLGSRAVAGQLGGVLAMRDADGMSIRQALEAQGKDLSPEALAAMALPAEKAKAYVEVHIEQGPVLEELGRPVGVVAGIAGQTRLYASVAGEQGHAGTVPMAMRKDPMPLAARVIARLEEMCQPGVGKNQESNLVCTVGSISVYPNAGNVIPRYANFTIDIRSRFDDNRHGVVDGITRYLEHVCAERGMQCSMTLKNEAASVHSSEQLTKDLVSATEAGMPLFNRIAAGASDAARAAGGAQDSSSQAAEAAPVLVSGAGHDAMVMAKLTRMAMLFVRCRKGISHSAEEFASKEDVSAGTVALYYFLRSGTPPAAPRDEL